MKIIVNGSERNMPPQNLDALLASLNVPTRAVVVEINGEIVHREQYAARAITENDCIEIIRFVGGG